MVTGAGCNLRLRSDDELRGERVRVSVIVSHEPLVRGERLTIRLTVSLTSLTSDLCRKHQH